MDLRFKGLLIFAVLAISLYYCYPTYQAYREGGNPQEVSKKVNLGLDLQGGMYLDIEVLVDEAVNAVLQRTAQELEDNLIDNQVDYLRVEVVSDTQLVIELASGEKVDFNASPYDRFLVQFDQEEEDTSTTLTLQADEVTRVKESAIDQALEVIRNRIDQFGVTEPTIQKRGDNSILIQLPGLKDRDRAIKLVGTTAVLQFFLVQDYATENNFNEQTSVLKYEEEIDPVTGKVVRRIPYVLEKKPVLTGEFIRDAQVRFDPNDNQPGVGLSFDSIGADRFGKITQKNRGRRLAIVLDDKVKSAPVIREAILGGEASISGQFTIEEASDLAVTLRSGALPAPIEIREERTVGASLGEDSVRQGLTSLVIGAVVVLIFMMIYYMLSGVFANVALIFNLILVVAVLGMFEATLTLPGMAGMVLTLGMSVDANVLIFERIREEIKRAGHPRAAISEGFNKAFLTIVDANITTLFGALALLQFGRGPIKGFAVTLSIGILASMFTAIVVTRFFFQVVYLNRKQLKNISI
ncbi:MAG: protein translocase subunit SecD [SAR324 cluster bacterium]|nr:protein translocase subunit SecD [SAR324 cluster bacterium]